MQHSVSVQAKPRGVPSGTTDANKLQELEIRVKRPVWTRMIAFQTVNICINS